MAIEKADDDNWLNTYVDKEGNQHPLVTGKWYQGFYNASEEDRAGGEHVPTPGIVAYWDNQRGWLKEPGGDFTGVMLYDYYVEAEVAVRPPKTVQQRFTDAILTVKRDVDYVLDITPSLKTADHCAANGAQWFKAKDYLRAHVWYLMAASCSIGQPLFVNYEEAADNARTLAFAEFCKTK